MGDVKITHLVKWAMTCAPLHFGGLAIRSLEVLIKFCLENGYGDLGISDRPCGGE